MRRVFEEVTAVRKLGAAARELADRHFFETLVRLHRAGEGAPYTGLKPAGQDLGPAVSAADRAIEDRSVKPLRELLSHDIDRGLQQRFRDVVAKKNYAADDPDAGREYVRAYVELMHYVERVHKAGSAKKMEPPTDTHLHGAPQHEH